MYPFRVIFSFQGRIGRRAYWAMGFPAWIASLGLFVLTANTVESDAVGFVLLLATLALSVWVVSAIVSKRFRDSGASGWWALSMLVPLIGIFVPIIVGATATDTEADVPAPESLGE